MILLTGARGVVGQPLRRALAEAGLDCLPVSRTSSSTQDELSWNLEQTLSSGQIETISACHTLVHCAPIWLLSQHLEALSKTNIRRLIVFSSTSVISKKESIDPVDQSLVAQLSNAEQHLLKSHSNERFAVTIFRPSMVYGYGLDENVSHIAKRLLKMPLVPLAGDAQGLRQPVHADDLVTAVFAVLNAETTYGQTYELAGAERLSYREMVLRIKKATGSRALILRLPVKYYRLLLKIAARVTGFDYTSAMADRMNQDLIYDNGEAGRDFGYSPREFLLNPQQDLPR